MAYKWDWGIWPQNWSKLHEIWHFGHFFIIFTSKKIEMNPFFGSTILWRLLGDYEPSSVLYCYCKRLSSGIGAYGPKIGQNCMKYDFWALFDHFHFEKIEMNPFRSGRTIFLRRWKSMSHLIYFVGSVRGFWVAHMVPKLVKITWNMTFCALFDYFHLKKDESESIFWLYYFMETFGRLWAIKCALLLL